ncbi:M24 family metallopeptidase [Bariatricus massiliensis]|uniref:M24 family metallopeptidase n=1 Tax=Bariatricus massiliensis TaxID=1745713 RepID=UPI0012B54AE1
MREDARYWGYHYQKIGHDTDLSVHELPNIGARCIHILEENNLIMVEPGICIPGRGGAG